MRPPEARGGRAHGRDLPYVPNPLAMRHPARPDEPRDVVIPHYSFNSYSPEPVGAALYGGHEFSDEYGVPNGIPVQPGVAPGGLPYGPVIPPPAGVAPLLPMPGAPLPLPGGPPKIPAAPGDQPGMVRGGGHRQWNRGPANAPRQVYGAAPALPAFLPMQPAGVAPYAMQAQAVIPSGMMVPGASPPGILPVGGMQDLPSPGSKSGAFPHTSVG